LKTVLHIRHAENTPLKQGVNEKCEGIIISLK
jgi:hypothetical protein